MDAAFDVTAQAFSVKQISALNANSEQYLKAVESLKKKLEDLFKELHQ